MFFLRLVTRDRLTESTRIFLSVNKRLVIAAAIIGILSSFVTVLLVKWPETHILSNFENRWEGSFPPAQPTATYSALSVIDETRNVLSFDEQKALFAGLSSRLNDPASAQLRTLRRSKNKLGICGELNAKNGFGAYVGFVPFAGAIIGETAVLVMPPRDVAVSMPAEVSASMAKAGCLDFP